MLLCSPTWRDSSDRPMPLAVAGDLPEDAEGALDGLHAAAFARVVALRLCLRPFRQLGGRVPHRLNTTSRWSVMSRTA